ncbi:hypothetical protein J2X69_004587 [Algoriphagus sp. 4150]|uniref:hypothetical protein n=1 Tax=Algoriphagus sp. 4150 TaxID=2817756 RepID=UPI00285EB0DA|nr:hypothetical protein [Algoriphagus sp. 4150]MDR7132220.1 hypothetical protein [Algoriphagus sp. 4150]
MKSPLLPASYCIWLCIVAACTQAHEKNISGEKVVQNTREGRIYPNYLRSKPEVDACEWYAFGPARPDWILADLISIIHHHLLPEHRPVFMGDYQPPKP